jgi:hypothetical protein
LQGWGLRVLLAGELHAYCSIITTSISGSSLFVCVQQQRWLALVSLCIHDELHARCPWECGAVSLLCRALEAGGYVPARNGVRCGAWAAADGGFSDVHTSQAAVLVFSLQGVALSGRRRGRYIMLVKNTSEEGLCVAHVVDALVFWLGALMEAAACVVGCLPASRLCMWRGRRCTLRTASKVVSQSCCDVSSGAQASCMVPSLVAGCCSLLINRHVT